MVYADECIDSNTQWSFSNVLKIAFPNDRFVSEECRRTYMTRESKLLINEDEVIQFMKPTVLRWICWIAANESILPSTQSD